jgi:DNA invertase Pin-like site-specific DNA recombinase
LRLSVKDKNKDESDSIMNQENFLRGYIAERPELHIKGVFTDNGETGTTFERPAWNSLMRECHEGRINCIVVKDLSRVGRNYIETGDFLERILPVAGVRLIAVNDRYDSIYLTDGARLVSSIKNLVNDIYAKDISRKVSSAMRTKQEKGEFLGRYAAYGYLLDPGNKKKIIINPETAPVVRRIFEMKAIGLGNGAICKQLNAEGIPCPLRYRYLAGLTQNNKYAGTVWIVSTVAVILKNPLYLGHMTQGKQRRSICDGIKQRKTTPDEWIIVPDTHEPIITQALFDRAKAVIGKRADYYRKHR